MHKEKNNNIIDFEQAKEQAEAFQKIRKQMEKWEGEANKYGSYEEAIKVEVEKWLVDVNPNAQAAVQEMAPPFIKGLGISLEKNRLPENNVNNKEPKVKNENPLVKEEEGKVAKLEINKPISKANMFKFATYCPENDKEHEEYIDAAAFQILMKLADKEITEGAFVNWFVKESGLGEDSIFCAHYNDWVAGESVDESSLIDG